MDPEKLSKPSRSRLCALIGVLLVLAMLASLVRAGSSAPPPRAGGGPTTGEVSGGGLLAGAKTRAARP